MTQRLTKQRERLLRLREIVLKSIQQLTAEACGETTSYSLLPADAATDSFDRDLVLGLASFEQEGLDEIDAALKRIDDGTYGVCELTGRPIPWRRLKAMPWTRFSVEGERRVGGMSRPYRCARKRPTLEDRTNWADKPICPLRSLAATPIKIC